MITKRKADSWHEIGSVPLTQLDMIFIERAFFGEVMLVKLEIDRKPLNEQAEISLRPESRLSSVKPRSRVLSLSEVK